MKFQVITEKKNLDKL